MARQRAPEGVCRVCGTYGALSWEHVPPESAFNNGRAIELDFENAMKLDDSRGRISQRGAGAYTLCESCNNRTGSWYAGSYTSFSHQAMQMITANNGVPTLLYPYYIYPLRVIKQIITMAASIDGERRSAIYPDLRDFVLDRERSFLKPDYRVFMYFNLVGQMRRIGHGMAMMRLTESTEIIHVVEMSHPPFGFVFVDDGSRPDDRLIDVTHFTRYNYNEFEMIQLKLPDLPTHLGMPLDYRSRSEIEDQVAQSRKDFPDSSTF